MPNQEHIRQWTAALRDPDRAQVTGSLAALLEDGALGQCCLGVGCEVAGIERSSHGNATSAPWFTYDGAQTLPPRSFTEWLGVPWLVTDRNEQDVYVDWPDDLTTGQYLTGEGWCSTGDLFSQDTDTQTCAALNDGCRLTFAQIADVLDYFGVSEG